MPRLPHHALIRLTTLSLALAGGFTLTACTSSIDPSLAGPEFPGALTQNQTMDIQVVRGETTLQLTNTTAHKFGPSRLWVNRWFSQSIDGLDVGQSMELPLNSFRDQYGEAFRAGGFWATRKPQVVQQVQLETDGRLIGLIAVGKPTE